MLLSESLTTNRCASLAILREQNRRRCQQICQQPSSERVRKVYAELGQFNLANRDQMPDSIDDLRLIDWLSKPAGKDLTTQAQRPGPRDALIAPVMRHHVPHSSITSTLAFEMTILPRFTVNSLV